MSLYTAIATAIGGRTGRATSSDGRLDVVLSKPREMGGAGGDGTNPEQLFAAGYAACFESVLGLVAHRQKKTLTGSSVTAEVHVNPIETGGFNLSVTLKARLDGVSREEAAEMMTVAHTICPYSNATRGNIEVDFEVL